MLRSNWSCCNTNYCPYCHPHLL